LEAEAEGYFSGLVESARAGMRYRYRLNRGGTCFFRTLHRVINLMDPMDRP
jgi:hypothetical protein